MAGDVIFSIDKTNISIVQPDGAFVSDEMHYTDIEDATEISTRAFNKMTTSIPTPFARQYLYEGAFNTLINKESLDVEGMNPFKGRAFKGITINHYVIADALDMLEFLFEYGNDPHLVMEKWTKDDLMLLRTEIEPNPEPHEITVEEKHNLLYESIMSNTTRGRLGEEFYIFKWRYEKEGHELEEVIGATSPLTLVYTAPNWRTNKPVKFYGGKGNELFVKDLSANVKPVPLSERAKAFRQYLYALQANYGNNTPFFKYIDLTRENYEQIEGLKLDQFQNFNTDPVYMSLNDEAGLSIEVTGVPLKRRDKGILDPDCEFVIVPTVEKVLDEYNANDVKFELSNRLPLVLSAKGIQGNEKPHYWYEAEFSRNNAELRTPSDESYFDRKLPNVAGMVKYPNLRAEDFFEDKIVRVSYNLDRNRFITGTTGNSQFLLPIKPTYFKFFKSEDLKKQLSIVPQNNGSVKVTLTIPVVGKKTATGHTGATVVLEKTYANNEQAQVRQIVNALKFNLAVFPFYRLEGTDSQYNCYEVMLGHDGQVSLDFYNEDINNLNESKRKSEKRSCVKIKTVKDRTSDSDPAFGISTTYYHVGDEQEEGTFQFIRAKFSDGTSAVIAPDWSTARAQLGNDEYVVSVDFGTTNTHIAYAQIKDGKVLTETIKDLEYNEGTQVVALSEPGSAGVFGQFGVYMQREFVPVEISESAKVKFPIGTLIYEKEQTTMVNTLFGDMNIAFDLNEEKSEGLDNGKLQSNIKWSHDPNATNRLKAFFTEIMWIVKNKIVEIGGRMNFNFIFTFPQSMRPEEQGKMASEWNAARKAVRAGDPANNWSKSTKSHLTSKTLKPYEGLAPWYSSLPDFGTQQSFLNIDIGGGTFDVIAVKPTTSLVAPGMSFSAQFAANELWGEGQRQEDVPANGFYNYYRGTQYCHGFTEIDKGFSNYYNPRDSEKAPKPSEVIPYLFKHDENESGFSNAIQGNPKLRSLVLLHFSSIVYYVGRVLLLTETNCPKNIQFTGMGSLYINLISDDDDTLTALVRSILEYATDGSIDIPNDFRVWFKGTHRHPKKITAQGALTMWNTTLPECTTPMIDSKDVTIYGFEGDEDDPVTLTDKQLEGQRDAVMKRMEHLLGLFNDQNFSRVTSEIGITEVSHLRYDAIKNALDESFSQMSLKNNARANGSDSKEVIFFWPLKDAIHKLALKYAK